MPADKHASKNDDMRSGSGELRSYQAQLDRRRERKAYLTALIVVAAVIGACLLLYAWPVTPTSSTATPDASIAPGSKAVERTSALAPLNLPADEAPHGSRMEWWYYSGFLDAEAGNSYAFHMVVFVANGLVKHTAMHAALTDLQTGKRYTSQTRMGGVPAKSVANGFDFGRDKWQMSATGSRHVLRAAPEGASVSLDLSESRAPVAHRAAGSDTPGLLDFGVGGISYYYSRPRLAAQGEVTVGGKPVKVRGQVWFDHQWGDFDAGALGWNWLALHLADGSDVMLYELFDTQGRKLLTAGTLSNASGSSALKPSEVELTPVKRWTSPSTGIEYVVEWSVKLPSGVLSVKPFVADSEFDSLSTTGNIYWEGPVKVTGSANGRGFLEMSGYDRLKASQSMRK